MKEGRKSLAKHSGSQTTQKAFRLPLWTWLAGLLILPTLLLLHELGHYLAARRAGIDVEEFAVGFGPQLAAFRAGSTQWTVRATPLGGYVRFAEEGPGSYREAPLARRALVMAAGPAANLTVSTLLMMLAAVALGYPWWQAPRAGLKATAFLSATWVHLFTGLFAGGGGVMLGGPVMITSEAIQASAGGAVDILFFSARLSLTLGLTNLLPVPLLDGGRLTLLGLEWVRRRPLNPTVEGWIYAGSFVALAALGVLLVGRDVLKLAGVIV